MVETGPTMPICEVMAEPSRCTAIIVTSTGSTVHTVPLSNESA